MPAYVDIDYVKLVGSMPASDVDALEALYPGTVNGVAEAVSRMFDARLAKRYAAPFSSPYPEALRWNVAQVVAAVLWQKRGYNPGSAQDAIIQENKADALAWLKEAADSEKGLVELPLREDKRVEGVSRGGPLGYSETSPYVWTDHQRDGGRADDRRS
ncbi:MAG: DUF1320 family protein [Labilithrix sp.]|nr:DUF1320 family protein [Labilithrix sp.]